MSHSTSEATYCKSINRSDLPHFISILKLNSLALIQKHFPCQDPEQILLITLVLWLQIDVEEVLWLQNMGTYGVLWESISFVVTCVHGGKRVRQTEDTLDSIALPNLLAKFCSVVHRLPLPYLPFGTGLELPQIAVLEHVRPLTSTEERVDLLPWRSYK